MRSVSTKDIGHIAAVREFNRFYTARLGLLQKRHLGGDFSLTQARILYEIGSSPELTASVLCNTLRLDAGYMSRVLASLARRKLVRHITSKQDGREKLLSLSARGRQAVSKLNEQSALHIQELLQGVRPAQQDTLIEALLRVRSILSEVRNPGIRIVRLSEASEEAFRLLREYYEAIHVVQRDTPKAIQQIIEDDSSGVWLAYLDEKAVGCVVLKRLPSIPFAGECKRLYVMPSARGHRIADKLMDAQEEFAKSHGIKSIYLDSFDDLKVAIALYRKRGYVPCESYNDNPQATVFLHKDLG